MSSENLLDVVKSATKLHGEYIHSGLTNIGRYLSLTGMLAVFAVIMLHGGWFFGIIGGIGSFFTAIFLVALVMVKL